MRGRCIAVAIGSDFARGFFNRTTAWEVGERLKQMLDGQPFLVFTKANPNYGTKVLWLVGGESAVTCHPEAARSCLLLNTTQGYVELGFGLSEHHRNLTYQFTTEGNLLVEDGTRAHTVTVVMPLRAAKPEVGAGMIFVPGSEYTIQGGNADRVAAELHRRLSGRTVVFANPDAVQGLDRFRFPEVKAVWVGEGFDDRLVFEIEGQDLDGAELEDHVFLLASDKSPNALGENVAVTFFRDGNIQLLVRPKNSMYRRTYAYWAVPNL